MGKQNKFRVYFTITVTAYANPLCFNTVLRMLTFTAIATKGEDIPYN